MRYIGWIKNIATMRIASSGLSFIADRRNSVNKWNAFNNVFRLISCFRYDLEIDSLYSISWYKDNEEFYKYIARAEVNRHTHPITGVKIDVSKTPISAFSIAAPVVSPFRSGPDRLLCRSDLFSSPENKDRLERIDAETRNDEARSRRDGDEVPARDGRCAYNSTEGEIF